MMNLPAPVRRLAAGLLIPVVAAACAGGSAPPSLASAAAGASPSRAAFTQSATPRPTPAASPTATPLASPPISGAILYTTNGKIHLIDHVGDRAITTGEGTDSHAAWSASGKSIMFSRYLPLEVEDIWLRDSATGAETRLTTTPEAERNPRWSRDEKQIAFVTFDEATGGQIWTMYADGSRRHVVYADRDAFMSLIDWAPDDQHLLMAIDRGGGGQLHLYLIGVDGKGLSPLTSASGDQSGADFSPDGARIAYWADASAGERAGIFIMNADGSDAQRVMEDDLEADIATIAWSPDGTQLAWAAKFEGGTASPLFMMDVDGKGRVQLTNKLSEPSFVDWGQPNMR